MRVLIATDVDWLVDDVVAALGDERTSFTVCSEGREVSEQVAGAAKDGGDRGEYDIVIADLQIGSMGGMAVAMALRLDASAGLVPPVPVLMLLDRVSDVHLAKRSGADGWLIKPLDPLRLRRAVRTVAAGGRSTEGLADVAGGAGAVTTGPEPASAG